MPDILLPVPHQAQADEGECLAACAAMVLHYIGFSISYEDLLRRLRVQWYGAAASNLLSLESLGIEVLFQHGTLAELSKYLAEDSPVIVFVKTGDLPYWDQNLPHAMVVVGLGEVHVYVNDPAFTSAPIPIPRGDFELAWLERDEFYAVLKRRG